MGWMKNKPQPEAPAPPATSRGRTEKSGIPSTRGTVMNQIVNIGQSIQIKGELTGNEDLTIEGKVDGKIFLKDHNLTIGANGRITAEIHAKSVHVIGEVIGNISADDKVEIAETGSMNGDIIAPRVVLGDGARFKGSIDMEKKSAAGVSSSKPTVSDSRPAAPAIKNPAAV